MQDMQVKNHWTQDSVKINHDVQEIEVLLYFVGTKKNPLDEAVLFSILKMFLLCNAKPVQSSSQNVWPIFKLL